MAMEFCKHLCLEDALEHLNTEIKEISQRWINGKITMIAMEKHLAEKKTDFTDEEQSFHDEIEGLLAGKKDKKRDFALRNASEEKKAAYNKIEEYKNKLKAVEHSKSNMKQWEEFLEVAQGVKKEIEKVIKK